MNEYHGLTPDQILKEYHDISHDLYQLVKRAQEIPGYDQRKLAISRTNLETAFYWLDDGLKSFFSIKETPKVTE